MLEFKRVVDEKEYGPTPEHPNGLVVTKTEYHYDGFPLCIQIAGARHYLKCRDLELTIPIDEPESPLPYTAQTRYVVHSQNGYWINDIVKHVPVQRELSAFTRAVDEVYPEQEVVLVPEDCSALECFGITVPVYHKVKGNFMWFHQMPLVEYLELKNEEQLMLVSGATGNTGTSEDLSLPV